MTRICVVEKAKCNPDECGNYLCIRVCPVNRMGEECIVKGSGSKVVINEKLCSGCGICPKKCPFEALHIINLPEKLAQKPVHRYGRNGFELFNLPVPIFGKVVGILGRNGIGKSTAVKILAQVMKPNMGEEEEKGLDDLIDYFKGTEAQIFFEKLKRKEIMVAYKPQAVDLIPKTTKGKVRALLEKVDEKKQLEKIARELDIENILDNDVTEISGGELQRVAIAATVLKRADVYFFDEPASYLDIRQRIKVSKFIKGLADENTAVMVVEHDLIILDFMTDLVHIMFGQAGAYGIVSMPKPTRTAINVYLSGYLREENVRFRDSRIEFLARPPVKRGKKDLLVGWDDVEKKLGKFSLRAKSGGVNKETVVGVLGENGIGKTTFVRILAGEIKPDSGSVAKNVKVAYKPQYISSGSEEMVANVLKRAVEKYDVQLRPLDIKPLLLKKVNELSGGELQRVMIALCLSQDAELFLLDEPSAYLDVEQRLIVARVIREMMEQSGKSALIVDHDLLFIDYLSDSLMVFSGEPAVSGKVNGPYQMEDGMNLFLKDLNITLRRDKESKRPRINKPDSQMDRKQKSEGKLYYS